MATTNIYLSASTAADAWALYFGKGDARVYAISTAAGSRIPVPQEALLSFTRARSRLLHGFASAYPVAQEHEPALRYLSALFDNVKMSCLKTTVEFSAVQEDFDHAWLRRAQRLANSADDPEAELDWGGLTLHVPLRCHMRWPA
ncbi:hypothetical protein CYLTODRAFT_444566 [Cylindrobasidium torrendii FP15055 ss-10]|uniref:Uncharacterized protein n=1 Tax=Cylindrobasidium torrendii FP15055 ss-10 TaxID=1314674 RepID=A0A0D7BAP5_9AGAR|nr:hypothetical protein CYLTODRAFT_444566 [Cylindrobasidium torrendii FP15055 ss-10]